MSLIVSDTVLTITGTPVANTVITASPTINPLFENVGGTWQIVEYGALSATTDATGAFSITLPWPSVCDPSSVQWVIALPDGTMWGGTAPNLIAGPVSIKTLKDSYGWGLVSATGLTPIVAVQGPPGAGGGGGGGSVATTLAFGTVLVDNNSGGNPVALTRAGLSTGIPNPDAISGVAGTAVTASRSDHQHPKTTPLAHATTHVPGAVDGLDLTKFNPSGTSLPTLPNSLYPNNIFFIRTSDETIWQNQAGTWVSVSGSGGGGGAPSGAAGGDLGSTYPNPTVVGGTHFTTEMVNNIPATDLLSTAILADSPLIYWKLGEGAGPNAADSTGNGHTGTYAGSNITYSAVGPTGDSSTVITNAFAGAAVSLSSPSFLPSGAGTRTVECTFKTASGTGQLVSYGLSSSHYAQFGIELTTTTTFTVWMEGGSHQVSRTVPAMNDSQWHHIAATYDGINAVGFWLDGVFYGSDTSAGTLVTDVTQPLVVGGGAGGFSNFAGSIGHIALYSSVLSATRIQAHATATQNSAVGVLLRERKFGGTVVEFLNGSGDESFAGHLLSTGHVPTASAGANAGTSPPAPVVDSNASAVKGNITFGTGTGPAAGAQVAVTFNRTFLQTPTVVLSARNGATSALQLYTTSESATGFTIACNSAPSASQANTVYSVSYMVIGTT